MAVIAAGDLAYAAGLLAARAVAAGPAIARAARAGAVFGTIYGAHSIGTALEGYQEPPTGRWYLDGRTPTMSRLPPAKRQRLGFEDVSGAFSGGFNPHVVEEFANVMGGTHHEVFDTPFQTPQRPQEPPGNYNPNGPPPWEDPTGPTGVGDHTDTNQPPPPTAPPATPENPWVPSGGADGIGSDRHHLFNHILSTAKNKSTMSRAAFPRTKKVTLRWSRITNNITPPGVSAQAGGATFKLNSITNPGAGMPLADTHEPLGFSQYAAMYENFTVTECRVRWDMFLNEQATAEASAALDNVCVGLTPLPTSSILTNIGHYEELEGSVWTTLSPEQCGRLNFSVRPGQFFGVPEKAVLADETLRGTTNAAGGDPTNLLYLHVWVHCLDNVAETPVVDGQITAEFDVVFTEPKALVQS